MTPSCFYDKQESLKSELLELLGVLPSHTLFSSFIMSFAHVSNNTLHLTPTASLLARFDGSIWLKAFDDYI